MSSNRVKIELMSISENEAFARVAVAAFVAQLDPTIEELSDIKTAVSEAVTNSIIHGYENRRDQIVTIEASINETELTVTIEDKGVGIEDISQAKEPLYTSRPDLERSGMGFTVMETFMDELVVESRRGEGTKITMKKNFNSLS